MRCFHLLLCMLLSTLIVQAGQIPGHIYTAMEGRTGLSPTVRKMVDENLAAYLTGAQGPDTIGIIQYELKKISFFTSVGEETHYNTLKALLAFNVLDKAGTDAQRAYALGWMTHYVNDIYIHQTVNDYGGFYGKDPKHHKELEQLETKHVFMKHSDVVTKELATTVPTPMGEAFPGFIFDAYGATFPNDSKYQNGNDWGAFPNRDYFCEQEDKAAKWCLAAEQTFYNSHIDGTGKHGYWPSTLPIPNMPSNNFYQQTQNAIEILKIDTAPDNLVVTVKINDSQLYGRFLVDWEKAANRAIGDTRALLAIASNYLANPTNENKIALLRRIPNNNLDQPLENFDAAKVVPGNIVIPTIFYRLAITPKAKQEGETPKTSVVTGQRDGAIFKEPDYCGSAVGTLKFTIILPGPTDTYDFDLTLGMTNEQAFTHSEYQKVDWTQAEGNNPGSWIANVGIMGLGTPFTVKVPIPKVLNGNIFTGVRRWLIVSKDYVPSTNDLADIESNFTINARMRTDVKVLKEELTGDMLTATLQIVGMGGKDDQLLGKSRLMLIWSENGNADDLIGFDKIEKKTEQIQTEIDQLMKDPGLIKLSDKLTPVQQEILNLPITDEEKGKRITQKMTELVEEMGLQQLYADYQEKLLAIDRLHAFPYYIAGGIELRPVEISFPAGNGWTVLPPRTPAPIFNDYQAVEKSIIEKNAAGEIKFSVNSRLGAGWTPVFTNSVQEFDAQHAEQERFILTLGEYQGNLYIKRSQNPTGSNKKITGYALLLREQTAMEINFTIDGYSGWIKNANEDYRGDEDLAKNMLTLNNEVKAMYSGIVAIQRQE